MSDNNNELGKRIKNIRLSLGDNMREFGQRFKGFEASDSIVSRWEKGKSVPSPERLKRIAELGNISVNELLYGDLKSYIIKNLEIDKDKTRLEEINEMLKLYIVDNALKYNVYHIINNDNFLYEDVLKYLELEIYNIIDQMINSGRAVIEKLKEKDTELLKKHSNSSAIIKKVLENKEIKNIDIIYDFSFIKSFNFNDGLFEEEKEYNTLNQMPNILGRYVTLNKQSLNVNVKPDDYIKLYKDSQAYFRDLFMIDYYHGDVFKKLYSIFNNDIPKEMSDKLQTLRNTFYIPMLDDLNKIKQNLINIRNNYSAPYSKDNLKSITFPATVKFNFKKYSIKELDDALESLNDHIRNYEETINKIDDISSGNIKEE
ncbi:helix-turn-helix domain-containing protein [Macrococcoides caseolyticum]|uniref:helix-turn-helix domain-containing protein n=2 Tax=Macrococcoides caseolyticum TaxID=69966 RepID=UPI001E50DF30|nr:helix-turn-helix domain-containing protein [Macrococcus caseolyticus]